MKTLFLGCLAAAASCLTNLAGAVDHPNILWSHRSNGQNKVWSMGNAGDGTLTLKTGETSLPTNADPAWQMVGRGHFNKGANAGQDSHTDILWWHPGSKLSVVWFMSSGNTIIGTAWLPQNGDPNWTPMAVGDVDADGHADVIWQNEAYTAVWYLNPGNVNVTSITIAQGVLSNTLLTDLSYKIAAAGDADNDGDDDFVWYHTTLGNVAFWCFQSRPGSRNGNLQYSIPVGLLDDDLDWDLVGAGQYNSGGTTDLLWRHNTSGINRVWLLVGGNPEQPGYRWVTHWHDIDWRICNQRRLESTRKLESAIAAITHLPTSYFLRLLSHSALSGTVTFEYRTETDAIWGPLRARRREVLSGASTNAASYGPWTHRPVTFQNNTFSDTVSIGQRYEYEVYRKNVEKAQSDAAQDQTRLTVAIEGEPVDQPGSVLLVVANNISANPTLSSKIETLRTDLIAEGWKVYRSDNAPMHDDNVWSNNPSRISTVKTLIRNYYLNDLSLHTVLLIGHVAVPYSGKSPSDGHDFCVVTNSPDHKGAWSADLYYADVANEGVWLSPPQTNSYDNCHNTVNDTWEGSGKWTKESFPEVQMRVSLGRIDFANLGGASGMGEETMLMGRYLDKLHNYRTRNLSWQWDEAIYDRAAVYSHESNSQADIQVYLAQWRAASALVPNQSGIKVRDALFSSSLPYCWGFVFGPGSFRTISSRRYPEAIVHTSEQLKLVVNEARSPFWWIRASYMGDYNSYGYESAKPSNNDSTVKDWNYLRSLLTLGEYGLAVVWNGKDIQSWRLDAFALGDPLGAAQRRMVSNFTLGTEGLNSHLELVIHGDPTLRMHTLNAPTGLSGTRSAGDSISLTWTALAGLKYHVYAFNLATQTFDRVTVQPIQGGGFIFTNTSQTFMVRGLKLQQVGAGSYYKISPGTQTSIP